MTLSTDLRGTWLLESRVDFTRDGRRHPDLLLGKDPIALLIYDETGHSSAQFTKRDRSTAAPVAAATTANNTQAQGDYAAYFGTYDVDDSSGTVTQRLRASLSPANVGMVLTRAMAVRDAELTIKLETTAVDGEAVTRVLSWRKLPSVA